MRTFIFLLCTTVFSFTPDNVLSQNAKVTIVEDKTVTVDEVFDIIKEQTEYRFIYKSDMFKNFPKISLKKGIIKANRLLKQSLSSGNFNFNFTTKNTILIRESVPVTLQETKISGQIVDENGMPIPGITVYVTDQQPKGERISQDFLVRGTATDFDGSFSLLAEVGYYLVTSGLGYEFYTEQITAGKTVYNVTLKERASALDEVLVVGYGTTVKKDLTGSVGSVKSEDIQQIKTQTIDQALVGKIAGVHVTSGGGAPGSGAIVHIRGLSQINGDNQPLYVVDGVPITINPSFSEDGLGISVFGDRENPLLSINPNEIERVDVLKDASAAAIYGSRAANGVVIITTKRGKRNQAPRFNFSYNTTIQNPTDKLNYLNAEQYRTFAEEWAPQELANAPFPPFLYPDLRPNEYQIVNDPDNYFGNANTNWQDEILNKNAIWNQYNFSLSGGSEKTNYLVSATVNEQEGQLIGNKFSRYNFQTNIDSQLKDNLKIGASINYNYSVNKQSAVNNLDQANFRPDLGVFDENGDHTSITDFFGLNQINPLGNEAKVRNKAISKNLFGSVYGELKLLKDLKFKSQLSIGITNDKSTIFSPSFTSAALFGAFFGPGGASLAVQTTEIVTTSFNNTLNYNTTISEDHRIDAVAGISWDRNFINLESQTYNGFPDDEVLTNIQSANQVSEFASDATEFGLNSLFGRINYNYKDRYLLTLTGRYDASVKFGPENRRGFFPSAGFAWNVHNEEFFNNDSNVISNLKLRATLGRTGVDNLPAFSFEPKYLTLGNGDSFYNGVNGIAVPDVPNQAIKWESTDQLDLGVEFGLFNGRLNGEVVYFEKNTSGLILQTPIAAETGDSEWSANIADVTNTGWEISLYGDVIRTKDFTWHSSFNISFVNNNLEALNGGLIRAGGLAEGEPIGFINGYIVDGIAQTQQEIDALDANAPSGTYFSERGTVLQPGDYIYKDISGPNGTPDGEITSDDLTNIGDINPDFFGGWNNTLTYKNFSLSLNFQFVEGAAKRFGPIEGLGFPRAFENQLDLVLDTWTPDNTNATYARLGSFTHSPDFGRAATSKAVGDASYIKLRSASIGYNLPQDIIAKVGLSRARISISGNNLFTISDYPGQDPENSPTTRGGATVDLLSDNGLSYPQTRTFTFGVDLSF
ncbi:SusC/RagA family TonB-linked outer membrane protein [Flavivirga spongiicola]|uniref:TonB-dependent receptor n=1 Tax=Flavivirga spongiicola TaxID=421621 RepID=A0ABU7XW67_9FLAO|nr:TonB-dependent receptor [Flavivirga sp. MEBiC05379]MDO5979680.1 TonB-dependent receptor [Flavivirga sp. MEBiC05379]